MKKYILPILSLILFVSLAYTASASLGRFNPGDCVPIITAVNGTSVNITISGPPPNATVLIANDQMQSLGDGQFNYTFCNTTQQGQYNYAYQDNLGNSYGNSFEIGDTGVAIILILAIATILIFLFGWFQHNVYFVYISGILALILGVYVIINGFASVNTVYTQAIGYVSIGFAIIFFVVGAFEQLSGEGDSE